MRRDTLTRREACPERSQRAARSPASGRRACPERAERVEGWREAPDEGRSSRGFTLAELITVVAIIGILASVALPVARFGLKRQKEIELHERLRRITNAIDQYRELRNGAASVQPGTPVVTIKKPPDFGQRDYPKTLEELIKPIELSNGKMIHLLRQRDLIDPMTGKNEWTTLSDNDDPDTSSTNGDNVFEVHSKSTALALDGKTHYNEW